MGDLMLYPPDIVVLTRYWGILPILRLPVRVCFVSYDCTLFGDSVRL